MTSKPVVKRPRTTTHPFGDEFYRKLAECLMSKEEDSVEKVIKCCEEVRAYKMEHPGESVYDSGDDLSNDGTKAPAIQKRAFSSIQAERDRMRIMKLDNLPASGPVPAKKEKRLKSDSKPSSSAAPIHFGASEETRRSSKYSELSEESEEEGGDDKKCNKCSETLSSSSNILVECNECKNWWHQKCSRPEVTRDQAKDIRFIFVCADCAGNSVKRVRPESPRPIQSKQPEMKKDSRADTDVHAKMAEFKKKKMTAKFGSLMKK